MYSLTLRVHVVAIATQPLHALHIRLIGRKGDPVPFPKLHTGLCSSVGMRLWTDRHTDARD